MNFRVVKLGRDDWKECATEAHRVLFGELRPRDFDRVDYALLAVSDQEVPLGYVTCREHDANTVYWQFGGTLPPVRGTVLAMKGYLAFIEEARKKYKRIFTFIENNNAPMLKMALKVGFRIVGIRNFRGTLLLEHLLDFEGGT